jgi:hypothetical protein
VVGTCDVAISLMFFSLLKGTTFADSVPNQVSTS